MLGGLFARVVAAVAACVCTSGSALRGALDALRASGGDPSAQAFSFRRTLGVLRDSNTRRWYLAVILGNGWVIATLVDAWLVATLTGSGWWLGAVTGVPSLGSVLVALVAGKWADRPGTRQRLILAWSLVAGAVLALLMLTASGVIFGWGWHGAAVVCLIASVRSGAFTFGSVSTGTYQATVVGEPNVEPAARVGVVAIVLTFVIGPAIAGPLMEVNLATTLTASIACIGGAITVLGIMDARNEAAAPTAGEGASGSGQGLRAAIREIPHNLALKHVRATPEVLIALVALAILVSLASNYGVLLPLSTSQTSEGGAALFGWLTMAVGVGRLAGTLYCLGRAAGFRLMVAGCVVLAVSCVGAAVATSAALQFAVLVLHGVGAGVSSSAIATIVQAKADPAWRGRTRALYEAIGIGASLPGAFVVGGIAAVAGPSAGWVFQAVGAVGAAVAIVVLVVIHRKALAPRAAELLPGNGEVPARAVGVAPRATSPLPEVTCVSPGSAWPPGCFGSPAMSLPQWMKEIVGDARGREALALLDASFARKGIRQHYYHVWRDTGTAATLGQITTDAVLTASPDEVILGSLLEGLPVYAPTYWASLEGADWENLYTPAEVIRTVRVLNITGWVAICEVRGAGWSSPRRVSVRGPLTAVGWVRVTARDLPPDRVVVGARSAVTPLVAELRQNPAIKQDAARHHGGVRLKEVTAA